MSSSYQNGDQIPSYTIGDRINHPFILAREWEKCDEALVRVEGEQSEQEYTEAVYCFESSIPDSKRDELYYKERAEADTEIIVDARKEFMGKKVGAPKFRKEIETNPHKVKHAIVNLLDRKGKLSREMFVEDVTGERFPTDQIPKQ